MLRTANLSIAALLLVVAVSVSGCSQKCDVIQNQNGQEIVCSGATFQLTLQGNQGGYSKSFEWDNPRDSAQVSAVFQGEGNVRVTIMDSAGTEVYSKQHMGSGQSVGHEDTDSGEKGTWTVQVTITALSGQIVISVTPT